MNRFCYQSTCFSLGVFTQFLWLGLFTWWLNIDIFKRRSMLKAWHILTLLNFFQLLHNSITPQETTTFFLFFHFHSICSLYWSYSSDKFPHHCLFCFYGFFLCCWYNSKFSTLQAVISKPSTDITQVLIQFSSLSHCFWCLKNKSATNRAQWGFLVFSRFRHTCATWCDLQTIFLVLPLNPKVSYKDSGF